MGLMELMELMGLMGLVGLVGGLSFHFSIFTFLFSFLFSFSDIWIFFCIFAKCEGVRLAR